jgi:hypothetical protein
MYGRGYDRPDILDWRQASGRALHVVVRRRHARKVRETISYRQRQR